MNLVEKTATIKSKQNNNVYSAKCISLSRDVELGEYYSIWIVENCGVSIEFPRDSAKYKFICPATIGLRNKKISFKNYIKWLISD